MKATPRELRRLRDAQALVSIGRERFDENGIHGFVLHVSDELVLVQRVHDFFVDGLLLIRIADISEIKVGATNEFHRQLLIDEGEFEKVDFRYRPPIRSYDTFLRALPEHRIVILEDEAPEEAVFLIGTLIYADESEALVRYFNGAGEWEDEASVIEIPKITNCQTGGNYTEFYARHFARIGAL